MNSRQLFAVGLILIGLGVPRLVDAVEVAYGLDIKRDVGVVIASVRNVSRRGPSLRPE